MNIRFQASLATGLLALGVSANAIGGIIADNARAPENVRYSVDQALTTSGESTVKEAPQANRAPLLLAGGGVSIVIHAAPIQYDGYTLYFGATQASHKHHFHHNKHRRHHFKGHHFRGHHHFKGHRFQSHHHRHDFKHHGHGFKRHHHPLLHRHHGHGIRRHHHPHHGFKFGFRH